LKVPSGHLFGFGPVVRRFDVEFTNRCLGALIDFFKIQNPPCAIVIVEVEINRHIVSQGKIAHGAHFDPFGGDIPDPERPSLFDGCPLDILALKKYAAPRGFPQTHQDFRQFKLAIAGNARDAKNFPFSHREGDPLDR